VSILILLIITVICIQHTVLRQQKLEDFCVILSDTPIVCALSNADYVALNESMLKFNCKGARGRAHVLIKRTISEFYGGKPRKYSGSSTSRPRFELRTSRIQRLFFMSELT
jgi:hypothetical protein